MTTVTVSDFARRARLAALHPYNTLPWSWRQTNRQNHQAPRAGRVYLPDAMGFWAAKSVLLSSNPLMLVGSSLAEGLPSASGERLTSPLGPREEARRELCMGYAGTGVDAPDVNVRTSRSRALT